MAALMFSSSIGFSMDAHFCGNELKSLSLFGEAEACEMGQAKQEIVSNHSCCQASKLETTKCHNNIISNGNCCHNETLGLDNTGELEKTNFSKVQAQHVLLTAIALLPNFNFFATSTAQVNYTHYIPPPLIKEVSILHQVFRI